MSDKKRKVPKLRFPGFTDDWEQRKLDKITDVRDGTHASPKFVETGYPLVTSKNVGEGNIDFSDIQYISEIDYHEINKRSKVNVNDILLGMIGTIGNMAKVKFEPNFAIKNVALIKDTGTIDMEFLYHALQSSKVQEQVKIAMDGGTQKFLALNKIRSLIIGHTEIVEQNEIGSFFFAIDSFISLHQRKLDHLKELKKGLLQQMFV